MIKKKKQQHLIYKIKAAVSATLCLMLVLQFIKNMLTTKDTKTREKVCQNLLIYFIFHIIMIHMLAGALKPARSL